jgi:hypothetical protein
MACSTASCTAGISASVPMVATTATPSPPAATNGAACGSPTPPGKAAGETALVTPSISDSSAVSGPMTSTTAAATAGSSRSIPVTTIVTVSASVECSLMASEARVESEPGTTGSDPPTTRSKSPSPPTGVIATRPTTATITIQHATTMRGAAVTSRPSAVNMVAMLASRV